MRSEKEMFDLILGFAKEDDRVRAVYMNGSRANPNAPKDQYQDYDIVYVVKEFETFVADHSWIDRFGERFMLQMPETMRYPSKEGHFNWMMLFTDGNRLDLTLLPIEKPELISDDSQTVVLLDKDQILPKYPPANDSNYYVKKPTELFYLSCCNNFWWCLQNVAKGIAREELPYAMLMYHQVVRQELHDMIRWSIGCENDFAVSPGKMGKYFKKYLPEQMYQRYLETYCDSNPDNFWNSVFVTCRLFRELAQKVGSHLGYIYNQQDDDRMMQYIRNVWAGEYKEEQREM